MILFVKYAPGLSRFNPVERKWSHMTKMLANIILRPETEEVEEEADKEKVVDPVIRPSQNIDKDKVKQSLNIVQNVLKDFTYDGYPWKFPIINPDSTEVEIDGAMHKNDYYTDLDQVNEVYQGAKSKAALEKMGEKEQEILKEAKFFAAHCERRRHMMVFSRCQENKCKKCKSYYNRYSIPKKFWKVLDLPSREKEGGLFFNPKPDPKHPDNNMTYLDQVTQLKTGSLKIEMDSDLKDGEAVKCKVLLYCSCSHSL